MFDSTPSHKRGKATPKPSPAKTSLGVRTMADIGRRKRGTAGGEQFRGAFQELLLPTRNLITIDPELPGQLGRRLVCPGRRQGHPGLERCPKRATLLRHRLNLLTGCFRSGLYTLSGCRVFGVHYSVSW